MYNKFFGQYLLEKGAINKNQLLLAIDLQKASHLTLGQIGVEKGYLAEEEARLINIEQHRTDERFGSLAVAMGYLEGKQVSELFITQQNVRKFFGEVLVEQNILDKAALVEHLVQHADLKRQSALKLDSAVYAHAHGKLIAETISTTVRLFLRIAKIKVKVSYVSIEKIELTAGQLAFSQSAMLPEPVKMGYMMEKKLIGAIANNFLDLDVSDNPAVSQDAVCEFLNIVMGNSLASHSKESLTALSPPQISECGVDLQESYQHVFNIVMATPEEDLVLYFYD